MNKWHGIIFSSWEGTSYTVKQDSWELWFQGQGQGSGVQGPLASQSCRPGDLHSPGYTCLPELFDLKFLSTSSPIPSWLSLAKCLDITQTRLELWMCVNVCLLSEVQPRIHRWHIRKKKYSKMSKIYSHSQFPRGPLAVNWNFCLLYWTIKVAATTPRCPSVLKRG